MQTPEIFNDRLDGPPACRKFEVSATSEGSFMALVVITIELLQVAAASQTDGDTWLRQKRLKLLGDLSRLYPDAEQKDDLRHAIDTMDIATGGAWGRLYYTHVSAADTEPPKGS